MTTITVVILTKNEERFIERCIRSVRWADEVLVLDSGSVDQTKEIAASLGASVHEQPWLGWSAQRNRGAALAQHDWVLMLDADEIVTPELAASLQKVMRGPLRAGNAYALDRRGDFLGVLLPNESRPSKRRTFVRFYNRTESAYDTDMSVHEEVRFPGEPILVEGVLLHWNGHTVDEFVALFNRYATVEAAELDRLGKRASALDIILRPLLRFLWSYVARGGFRLGTRGLMHSMLKGVSDYIRYAKLWELQHEVRLVNPPASIYTPETQNASQSQARSTPSNAAD